ncbi:MAG: ester cyclase [Sandaracinus sp.]|nr:ester cyclase [Sandaracinus sp.]
MRSKARSVAVRSSARGTPRGPFLGVEDPGGRRFDVATIDLHAVVDGKMVRSFHVEDWAAAINQLPPRRLMEASHGAGVTRRSAWRKKRCSSRASRNPPLRSAPTSARCRGCEALPPRAAGPDDVGRASSQEALGESGEVDSAHSHVVCVKLSTRCSTA